MQDMQDTTKHLKLVHLIAQRNKNLGDYEDLVQAGFLGVLRARETYDPTKGAFSTYAAPWIRHFMQVDSGSKRVHRLDGELFSKAPESPDQCASPGPSLDDLLDASRIMQHIDALEDPHRRVILGLIRGELIDDTARGLGCGRTKVTEIRDEARRLLRERLAA